MASLFRRLGPSELLPRYIFAESLFARRRVLEVGAVASTHGDSAAFLLQRGARQVVAVDHDEEAIAEARKKHPLSGLHFALDVLEGLEPRSFDFLAVADVTPWVRAPELLKQLLALLSPQGHFMGGLRNPSGLALSQLVEPETEAQVLTFGQLLDALTPHFRSVEVASQTPLLGYQVGLESVSTLRPDRSLLDEAEAGHFLVLAGQSPVKGLDTRWVQLPPQPLTWTQGRLAETSQRARDWQERADKLKKALEAARLESASMADALEDSQRALEAAREAQSLLTARLESAFDRPAFESERQELALRIRRLQSENVLLGEKVVGLEKQSSLLQKRLDESEQASRENHEKALIAAETARLEKARKEQWLSQVEEARQRLEQALETAQRAQEEAASARAAEDRSRLAFDRAQADLFEWKRDVQASRDSELRLATQHSRVLEQLEQALRERDQEEGRRRAEEQARLTVEAERERALRHAEAESARLKSLWSEMETERAKNLELRTALDAQASLQVSLEAELQAVSARVQTLSAGLEEARVAGERLHRLNLELESRLQQAESVSRTAEDAQVRLSEEEAQGAARERASEEEAAALREELEQAQAEARELRAVLAKMSVLEAPTADVELSLEDEEKTLVPLEPPVSTRLGGTPEEP